ncbi:hypothetical protein X975_11458, partial [Stegodyphus mimosarum]
MKSSIVTSSINRRIGSKGTDTFALLCNSKSSKSPLRFNIWSNPFGCTGNCQSFIKVRIF